MSNTAIISADVLMRLVEAQSNYGHAMQAIIAHRLRDDLQGLRQGYREASELGRKWLAEVVDARRVYGDAVGLDIQTTASSVVNSLLMQADLERGFGNETASDELIHEALTLARTHLSPLQVAERERQCVSNLVVAGRFNEALVALSKVRDTFLQLGAPAVDIADVTSNMADILEWLGDDARALGEISKARSALGDDVDIDIDQLMRDMAAGALSNGDIDLEKVDQMMALKKVRLAMDQARARILLNCGEYDEAERLLTALRASLPGAYRPVIGSYVAKIRLRQGRHAEVLEEVNQIAAVFDAPPLLAKRGVLHDYRAEALLGLNRPVEALAAADEAIRDLEAYHDNDTLWRAHWIRAQALNAMGQPAAALEAYAAAADVVSSLRKAPLGFRLDSLYLRRKLPLLNEAIALAAKTCAAEQCCRFMEMVKARTLTTILSTTDRADMRDSELDREADQLARALDALEYQGYSQGWSDEGRQRKTQLSAARAKILERIRYSDPRWRSMTDPAHFDIAKTLELLARRGQAALTLWQDGDDIIAVLLKDRQCLVDKVRLDAASRKALDAYVDNLSSCRAPHLFDLSDAFNVPADAFIPSRLLADGLHAPNGLLICPHRSLHLVAWSSMTFQGARLFESCPVAIIPNLSCIATLTNEVSSADLKVALIGAPRYAGLRDLAPLAGAEQEIQVIGDMHAAAERLIAPPFVADKATEENFWQLFEDKRGAGGIFHVACHATFDSEDPLSSGLLLENGKADAAEIAAKRITYHEVVLSACSTGRRPTVVAGVDLAGDDILGLPGAFLEAGAKSILVSIPPAQDAAALVFCATYHSRRADGSSPLRAFQEAQMELLSAPDTFPPWSWAGFTYYGT